MAGKIKSVYICSECGYESLKWMGKCSNCNEWNTLNEEVVEKVTKNSFQKNYADNITQIETFSLYDIDEKEEDRYKTGISELDRVLGGGIVKGSLVLLSGEPGAGKSTILLQISDYISKNLSVLYISGEESVRQIKLRAKRLGINSDKLLLSADNNIINICTTIEMQKPNVVVIDSIQTMNLSTINSSPGSVTQVRECTNTIMKTAKSENIPVFIVGHVNKDGAIAGPKVLEHIVDTVLYFEGDRNLSYRILRAVKNRYGSTNEIGVFDMTDKGLEEITN
ncbi:MAG: ATPase domain-containing protein, partial [Oscillospiraceae bacterium]